MSSNPRPRPICFMVMPYGKKRTDASPEIKAPAEINFDALWDHALKPADRGSRLRADPRGPGYRRADREGDAGAALLRRSHHRGHDDSERERVLRGRHPSRREGARLCAGGRGLVAAALRRATDAARALPAAERRHHGRRRDRGGDPAGGPRRRAPTRRRQVAVLPDARRLSGQRRRLETSGHASGARCAGRIPGAEHRNTRDRGQRRTQGSRDSARGGDLRSRRSRRRSRTGLSSCCATAVRGRRCSTSSQSSRIRSPRRHTSSRSASSPARRPAITCRQSVRSNS